MTQTILRLLNSMITEFKIFGYPKNVVIDSNRNNEIFFDGKYLICKEVVDLDFRLKSAKSVTVGGIG